MKRALAVVAVLAVLAAGWFLVHDDGGRKAVPHIFDNMSERPLTDAQHVEDTSTPAGRKVRLLPPGRFRRGRFLFFFRPDAGRG